VVRIQTTFVEDGVDAQLHVRKQQLLSTGELVVDLIDRLVPALRLLDRDVALAQGPTVLLEVGGETRIRIEIDQVATGRPGIDQVRAVPVDRATGGGLRLGRGCDARLGGRVGVDRLLLADLAILPRRGVADSAGGIAGDVFATAPLAPRWRFMTR
jgi:hypothetical protein